MDINLLRSLVTLAAFAAFVGIVWWAYGPARKERFERDAQLPFIEDDPSPRKPAEGGAGSVGFADGCDPGAGFRAEETARSCVPARSHPHIRHGAPAPRFGTPLPSGEGKVRREMTYRSFPNDRMGARR